MPDEWQIVRQRSRKAAVEGRIYVSLNRRGEIAMNERAFREIGRPASVTLLYDADTRSIGVKFPVAIDRHFFPARAYGRGRRMRIVRAALMLKQFGIEVERTLVFVGARSVKFQGSPMLILSLEEAKVVSRRADRAEF